MVIGTLCCLAKPLVPPAAPKRVEARTAAAAMNEKAAAERSPDGPRGARPRSRSRSRDRSASEEEPPRRFERGYRVVCCIGGEWGWAAFVGSRWRCGAEGGRRCRLLNG